MKPKTNLCPCGTGLMYASCCGEFMQGKPASTAEQLMRSRYTAYVNNDEKYLLNTWHENTRPSSINLHAQKSFKWTGLKVLSHSADVDNPDKAKVEFVARYKVNGKAEKIHELSRFLKVDGSWFYIDGDLSSHSNARNRP